MKAHTIEGQRMLEPVGGVLADVGQIVRASHEHWDGTGYPDSLRGDEIPLEARIVSACDAYNAMTTDRLLPPGARAARRHRPDQSLRRARSSTPSWRWPWSG